MITHWEEFLSEREVYEAIRGNPKLRWISAKYGRTDSQGRVALDPINAYFNTLRLYKKSRRWGRYIGCSLFILAFMAGVCGLGTAFYGISSDVVHKSAFIGFLYFVVGMIPFLFGACLLLEIREILQEWQIHTEKKIDETWQTKYFVYHLHTLVYWYISVDGWTSAVDISQETLIDSLRCLETVRENEIDSVTAPYHLSHFALGQLGKETMEIKRAEYTGPDSPPMSPVDKQVIDVERQIVRKHSDAVQAFSLLSASKKLDYFYSAAEKIVEQQKKEEEKAAKAAEEKLETEKLAN